MEERTIGWLLDEADRAALLARFPPAWPDVIAHHVTLQSATEQPLPTETSGEIVGEVDDGKGLQALVIAISGTTDRPDGSTYHVTWSLDKARGREQCRATRFSPSVAGTRWTPFLSACYPPNQVVNR